MLIDSHAHILSEFYKNIEEVVKEAKDNNVGIIINCADCYKTSKEVINLSKKFKNIYPAVGIHPEYAKDEIDNIKNLEEIIKKEKIIAIGEIGLDYYYTKEFKNEQIIVFKKQLELAQKYKLPVIIHSREATKDTLNILKEYDVKGVIHCFNGSVEIAKEYIKMGYKLGVNGIVTFKNSKNIKEMIKKVGIEHFILETDCPFLTPEPYRKYKNEPKYIPVIAEYLSSLLNLSVSDITRITKENVFSIFDIK